MWVKGKNSQRQKPNIQIRQGNRKQRNPEPNIMKNIKKSDFFPQIILHFPARFCTRRATHHRPLLSTNQVPQRVTTKNISGQSKGIDQNQQSPEAKINLSMKPKSMKQFIPMQTNQQKRKIKKITMKIVQNKRKTTFTSIFFPIWLLHRTGHRRTKNRPVINLSPIITGQPKPGRNPQKQKCRRNRPKARHKWHMIKWRNIRPPSIIMSKKRRPSEINSRHNPTDNHHCGQKPPKILALSQSWMCIVSSVLHLRPN